MSWFCSLWHKGLCSIHGCDLFADLQRGHDDEEHIVIGCYMTRDCLGILGSCHLLF